MKIAKKSVMIPTKIFFVYSGSITKEPDMYSKLADTNESLKLEQRNL